MTRSRSAQTPRSQQASSDAQAHNRPQKVCPVCQRPFAWRKKWERCWEDVVYCSQRCRRTGRNKPA